MSKLTSRKFWICVASFLGSVATSISGIATANEQVTTIGIVCGVFSAAIYAAAEAYVDGKAAQTVVTLEDDDIDDEEEVADRSDDDRSDNAGDFEED